METRDLITILAVLVSLASMLVVSRNARRATKVQAQNTDLTRIRDLRAELRETKDELTHVKDQATALSLQLNAAHERSIEFARKEIEMLQYARMPGVTMEDWLKRFDSPQAINS